MGGIVMAPPHAMQLTCARCKNAFECEALIPDISNFTRTTVVAIPHNPIICPHCGQWYLPFLQGVRNLIWGWQAIEPPADAPRIIEAPSSIH